MYDHGQISDQFYYEIVKPTYSIWNVYAGKLFDGEL